ncbi:coiled-coil domain-containing protein 113-like [Temnothorax curvispinosus]|uniref:Cilia- and flagella-associated protein 263 n=1 Tax=Temnothorax curvispinosus TaxID=300111 RepID=A0A6J1R5P4_9HYME|nr:coiled-coil domain-containing protein 113-like [Temnothorax curvispinosus]
MSRQQSSAFSIGSLVLTPKQDDFCYYEDMTETELRQALEDIVYSNLFLRLENDIFERYLARRDPESLQTIAQILETAKRVQKIAPQHSRTSPVISVTGSLVNVRDRDSVSVASVRSGSRHVTPSLLTARAPTGGTKITYMHRIEMANTEIRELQKGLEKFEQTSTKKKIYLRARMEESQISTRETCRTREEFEENVVQKGIDSITGKIPAEKFIRFVEERLKVVDIMVEQIRLKMTTIKCQIRKVKLQLKQRKELGEALRAIDFEQLNIENEVCIRKIDEKTQYLLEMKRIVGHYSIALSKHKEKVEGLMLIMNEIKDKIVSKRQEIINLQSEQIATKIEIEKAEKQLKSTVELIENFEVPSVIDSIKMRMKLQELQRIHKQLSRQREIQRITLKSRKQLRDIS